MVRIAANAPALTARHDLSIELVGIGLALEDPETAIAVIHAEDKVDVRAGTKTNKSRATDLSP